MTGSILALVLAATPYNPAMEVLVAKEHQPTVLVTISIGKELIVNGASERETRSQVEVALRRCGMSPIPPVTGRLFSADLDVTALGAQLTNGYAVGVSMSFRAYGTVDSVPMVPLAIYSNAGLATGASGTAGLQIRQAVASMLDEICNQSLQAREAAESTRNKK
jgi:hypothetical protein